MKLEGGFINNLSKVYGIYTLGFLGFVVIGVARLILECREYRLKWRCASFRPIKFSLTSARALAAINCSIGGSFYE